MSQEKIGDVLRAQGSPPAALESYRAMLAIRERLASADRGNAGWQRDLSVSQERIGDVLRALVITEIRALYNQGNYREAIRIAEESVASAAEWR